MINTLHVPHLVRFLLARGVGYATAVAAQWTATMHGTVAVPINGLVTYEFAETYDDTGVTGYDMRVLNALI